MCIRDSVFTALCSQLPEGPARGGGGGAPDSAGRGQGRGGRAAGPPATPFQSCITRRVSTPIGMHKTTATSDGQVQSSVDELYRLALGLENPNTWHDIDAATGWETETASGLTRLAAYGADGGLRSAFIRVPDRRAVVIVLTN